MKQKRSQGRQYDFCLTEYGTICKVPCKQWRPANWKIISKEEATKILTRRRKGAL